MSENAETIQENLEIEFKYYINVSNGDLLKQLAREANSVLLSAYLFDLETTAKILNEFAQDLQINGNLARRNLTEFKGRIRSRDEAGQISYSFDLKGPKDPHYQSLGLVAKPEISIPISLNLFNQISKKFPTGYLEKRRTICDLTLPNHTDISLKAEFDLYRSVNNYKVSPKFLVMEIEIPESASLSPQDLINKIRGNSATLNLNNEEIPLKNLNTQELQANESSELSDLISGRRLVEIIKNTIPLNYQKYFN